MPIATEIEKAEAKEKIESIGRSIVDLFDLKKNQSNGRYNTSWGDKSIYGLGSSVLRIANNNK